MIVFVLLGFGCTAYSQYSPAVDQNSKVLLEKTKILLKPGLQSNLLNYLKPEHSYLPTLGVFCILEDKIANKATFPVRMRLGSVDYVDKLEKKRN